MSQPLRRFPDHCDLKRCLPSEDVIFLRQRQLLAMRAQAPQKSELRIPLGFELGNTKTGKSGTKLARIYVWNLPSPNTCFGATSWCIAHCYNGETQKVSETNQRWTENWWWTLNNSNVLSEVLHRQLSQAPQSTAVRIHSSGDFFSEDYILFWKSIMLRNPNVKFWSYTRSWSIPKFKDALRALREMPNLQLYASWDNTMPPTPRNWPKSLVFDSTHRLFAHAKAFKDSRVCPEQFNQVTSCADCALCTVKSHEDILFLIH